MDTLRKIFCMQAWSRNVSDARGLKGPAANGGRQQDNHIPALFMNSDEANERQIFIAADLYKDKPIILEKVLIRLLKLLSNGKCTGIDRALEIVFQALRKYEKEKKIQIAGSAALYYIAKNKDPPLLLNHIIIKQHAVTMLLSAMDYHKYEKFLVYYGCLALGELKLDYDVTFEFKSLIKVSLHVLSTSDPEECLLKTGLYLLGVVAWQVNHKRRNAIGEAGAIKILLVLIKSRLDRAICDDILESAWATLWNIMNNTQTNCERFVDENGMKYFIRCLNMFPEHNKLTEKMMGVLTCIAEIKELRPRLMQNHFSKAFTDILYSNNERININSEYNVEQQILTAIDSCMDNPQLIEFILKHLSHVIKTFSCTRLDHILDKTLDVLNRYVKLKRIQNYGFVIVFVIVIRRHEQLFNDVTVRQRVVTTILTGMDYHKSNLKVVYNGCLSLNHIYMNQDWKYEFKRIVHIMIQIISNNQNEPFVQNTCTNTLNLVISQLNNEQKNELGDAGVIKKLMPIIKDRLHQELCDDVLKTAWSTIRKITDDVPKNCKRFLNGNGMKYFFACLKTFPGENKLKLNMMSLMSNVSDVKDLRPRLMEDKFIKVVCDVLISLKDLSGVTYNAARVIAQLASDGPKAWTISTPSRSDVLKYITNAIQFWDSTLQILNIDHRSLKSILQLAQVRHTPECVEFAVWVLANLTKHDPEKYCSIVMADGGIKIMSDVLEENYKMSFQKCKPEVIHSLAVSVINQCMVFMIKAIEEKSNLI